MSKRRVVVTGIGALTPLGHDVKTTWEAVLAGKSGISPIEVFDASEYPTRIGGSIKDFEPTDFMPAKDARKVAIFVQYGVAAAEQALQDSGLSIGSLDPYRIGVAVGSGIGGLPLIEKTHSAVIKGGPRKISPFFIPGAIINMVAGNISIKYGLKGPNIAIVAACTSASNNIGDAARMIAYGDADIMLSGGAEMATSQLGVGGFCSLKAMSRRNDEPHKASRPWDKDRDGFVLSDGAGILVLEELEHAKARGATIYAEVAGYGMSADAYHMTAPDPEGKGAVAAMRHALNDANLNPSEIDYINPHATSTPLGDLIEAKAIKETFGDYAYKMAVSSTKSMTGHLLGAAGAVEAIFSILAIRDQVVPPTINLDNPDEGCDLDFIPHTARELKINVTMSNSFGFGGSNGSLIFRKLSD